jgi:hypothetical protein
MCQYALYPCMHEFLCALPGDCPRCGWQGTPACGCIAGATSQGCALAASRRLGLTESPGLLYAVARMSVCIPAGCACRALLCIYLHSLTLSVLCSRYRLPAPVATVHVLAGSCSLGSYAWAPKGQVAVHGQSAGGAQPDLIDACKRWFCWKQTLWGPWQAAACLAGGRRRRARAARPVAAVCFSCARGSAPAPTC